MVNCPVTRSHFTRPMKPAQSSPLPQRNLHLGIPCLLSAIFCAALLVLPAKAQTPAVRHTFAIGEKDFLLDGSALQIRCGEIHFARVPREYWRQRLQMCRAM